jgi:hypothetical protein
MSHNKVISHQNICGTNETNGLVDGFAHHKYRAEKMDKQNIHSVHWDHPGLKVTRLRLLSDPGFSVWDVSYCEGELPNGDLVNVSLPFQQIPKGNVSGFIVDEAKKANVYAKRLGILDCISKLC